jgi:Uma2 family endonuclease
LRVQLRSFPPRPPEPGSHDNIVVLHGVTWDEYEAVLSMRGDGAGVRISFLEGELELMSPSRDHEAIKKCIARLVEAYAEERGLRLDGLGSMTIRSRPKERGVEPDECYEVDGPKDFPDLAIEVVWTNAGIDKLEIYRAFRVREVWVWRDGRIEVHVLVGEAYERAAASIVFPDIDLAAIADLATSRDQTDAVRQFRKALRAK